VSKFPLFSFLILPPPFTPPPPSSFFLLLPPPPPSSSLSLSLFLESPYIAQASLKLLRLKDPPEPGVVVHTYNLSTQEAEAGGLQV
jgi:hypothetical protein